MMPSAGRRLTREARELLRTADAGGVPMFASANLRRIARDNGVETPDDKTPNQIIDELRELATRGTSAATTAEGRRPISTGASWPPANPGDAGEPRDGERRGCP